MFKRIEFLVATAFFGFFVYKDITFVQHLTLLGNKTGLDTQFIQRGIKFNYATDYYKYFLYPDLANGLAVYLSFLFLNYYVTPRLIDRKKYMLAALCAWFTLAVVWIVYTITSYVEFGFDLSHCFIRNRWLPFALGGFALYVIFKKLVVYYAEKKDSLFHDIVQKFLVFALIWAVIAVFLGAVNRIPLNHLTPYWVNIIPSFVLLVLINAYWLMPDYEQKQQTKQQFIIRQIFVSLFAFAPFGIFLIVATETYPMYFFLWWLGELAFAIPLAWQHYQSNKARIVQILKLNNTVADLSLLRSQINPHFLFNALNTLYGTALQENSERTAEGIQQLGDMMRFMLHENHQEKIALNREVEYLLNYIQLQSLRIKQSPDVVIETAITIGHDGYFIAPMLLIPFVENAFKHGISLASQSLIRIALTRTDGQLTLKVVNSIHTKLNSDPEESHSGIGLDNVKQRLDILYPQKHNLLIKATATEYITELNLSL